MLVAVANMTGVIDVCSLVRNSAVKMDYCYFVCAAIDARSVSDG